MTFFKTLLKNLLSLGVFSVFCFSSFVTVNAASFSFSPTSKEFYQGCKSSINIMVDPASGKESNAADIEINYNPTELTILDSVSNIVGTQIKPGDAYETYFGNQVDASIGRIRLAGASFTTNLTSKKVFATIEFQTLPNVTSANFNIKFDGAGATLDSNVAEASTSDDLLTNVTNGSYTFVKQFCDPDKIPPVITFNKPQKYATGVALNSEVEIKITDNQSGVDLNSLVFNINGDLYTVTSPEITYTGSALDYSFKIKPRNTFYSDKESVINVKAKDIAGNLGQDQAVFNIPVAVIREKICPITDTSTSIPINNTPFTTSTSASTSTTSNNSTATSTSPSTVLTSTTNSTAQNSQENLLSRFLPPVLARTGSSMADILLKNYWWGILFLVLILILISKQHAQFSNSFFKKTRIEQKDVSDKN